jgi:hypothetical protein
MAILTLDYNLEDVEEKSFEPLPAAQYFAQIVNPDDVELKESSTGKPMLKIVWTVQDGEFTGRKIFDNVVLSVDWKVKQYADIAGIESGTELDTEDFVGVEALLDVVQDTYQGKVNNKIKTILPAK